MVERLSDKGVIGRGAPVTSANSKAVIRLALYEMMRLIRSEAAADKSFSFLACPTFPIFRPVIPAIVFARNRYLRRIKECCHCEPVVYQITAADPV